MTLLHTRIGDWGAVRGYCRTWLIKRETHAFYIACGQSTGFPDKQTQHAPC